MCVWSASQAMNAAHVCVYGLARDSRLQEAKVIPLVAAGIARRDASAAAAAALAATAALAPAPAPAPDVTPADNDATDRDAAMDVDGGSEAVPPTAGAAGARPAASASSAAGAATIAHAAGPSAAFMLVPAPPGLPRATFALGAFKAHLHNGAQSAAADKLLKLTQDAQRDVAESPFHTRGVPVCTDYLHALGHEAACMVRTLATISWRWLRSMCSLVTALVSNCRQLNPHVACSSNLDLLFARVQAVLTAWGRSALGMS